MVAEGGDPAGLVFASSGTGCAPGSGYTTPQSLSWTPGASCTVIFATPQTGQANVQYYFDRWEDNSTNATRTITAPTSSASYTATFTFTWTAGTGVDGYWLDAGPTVGSGAYSGGVVSGLTKTVTALLCNGQPVYARLWTAIGALWQTPIDYTFTAASRCRADPRATLTSPAAGSTLTGSSATFTWTTGTGADGYWLDVGASVGQGNLSSGFQTTVSRTITNLPGTGRAPCTSGSGRESAESTRRRSTTRLTKVSETNPNRRLGGSPWYERQFMLLALSLLTAFRVSFRTRGDTPLT